MPPWNALGEYVRAQAVQLAVMVDRSTGSCRSGRTTSARTSPTRRDEMVDVSEDGVALGEVVQR